MKVNGVDTPVWEIKPHVTKLTASKQNGKLRDATIYVTADSKREILQLKSEVFIGNVLYQNGFIYTFWANWKYSTRSC